METTEQKINLQLNIDGYKFFETTQSFDDDQTYSNLIPWLLKISILIDIPEKEANSIISDIRFTYDRNSLVKDIYDMLNESSLNIQDINKVIDIFYIIIK